MLPIEMNLGNNIPWNKTEVGKIVYYLWLVLSKKKKFMKGSLESVFDIHIFENIALITAKIKENRKYS